MNQTKIPVITVIGPTASGKTGLSVRLCKALDGEVVSGDSMQIYRGMDIGTAKPTLEEREGVPHHLIDVADPSETYSVAKFCTQAGEAVRAIHARSKWPVLCGGTGLYIDSFLRNTPFPEQKEVEPLREELRKAYDADGGESLYRELTAADPVAAAKIHKNNAVKVIRAVEILRSGHTLTQQVARTRETETPYHPLRIGLDFADRSVLYGRIERRVDDMVANGLLEEAKKLYDRRDTLGSTAAAAIGYKELFAYFDGACALEDAVNAIKVATRHYAKRQLTWFRRDPSVCWLDAALPSEEILSQAQKLVENFANL